MTVQIIANVEQQSTLTVFEYYPAAPRFAQGFTIKSQRRNDSEENKKLSMEK